MYALKLLDHGDLIHEYQSHEEALAALERVRALEPERARYAAIVEIENGHPTGRIEQIDELHELGIAAG